MKRKWWHEKVAYQIYPKSFFDANGDGVGDLRGIIEKLDYLKELGIDIIWISPIYQSPFVDQGYDISDYYAIDPAFGTMEEMEELLAEAKKRDMYILMDLVVNHCSDKHEWFQKALKDPDGEYGKYFYIMEGKEDGTPPCNWRSYFGGSVWEPIPGTNKYYLHMFAKEQPDLNWENPAVREEIYKMMNWWLDKGLSGFRIDAIINIKKDLTFSDLPADRDDGLAAGWKMLEHASGIEVFLKEMRDRTFRPHNAFSIGELFNFKAEDLENFIGDDGCFESIFDFSTTQVGMCDEGWYKSRRITPDEYRDIVFDSKKTSCNIGFLANIIENHDEPRGVSHYIPEGECNEMSKKMLAAVMMMSYGLPFLYQGQEIGMTNMEFESISQINDISTIDEYHVALRAGLSEKEALKAVSAMSRDNARTPVQWSAEKNAGFTGADSTWLPVNPNYKTVNVEAEMQDENSVYHFYKKLIALRKNPKYKETVVYGDFIPVWQEQDRLMAFYRKSKERTLLVIANYSVNIREIPFTDHVKHLLLNNAADFTVQDGKAILKGYQAVVLEVETV
ncbi:MAG: alpha-glucosidase [Clostridiales bacterium]|nr:alpha-glucosidase [Clostridiales bacterium]